MRIGIALALVVLVSGVADAGGGGGGGWIGGTPRPQPHVCCEDTPDHKTGGPRLRPDVPITFVEAYPKPLARDLEWEVERLRGTCFDRRARAPVRGRLAIDFTFGFEGKPLQIRVWGLDDEANRCVARAVARWTFDRYQLGWDEPAARVVAWVGDNDLPRLRTLRASSRGRACAD